MGALGGCAPGLGENATALPAARAQSVPETSATRPSGVAPVAIASVTAVPPPTPTLVPTSVPTPVPTATPINLPVPQSAGEDPSDQRTIAGLRARTYDGSQIEIVRTLATTGTYTSYQITYQSDGLRISGYLNVPRGPHGEGPFPVILANHGFVNPAGYVAVASNYTKREGDYLASRGYLVAGSDLRGHGNNPGTAVGSHLESAYVIDALNLLAALKSFPQADVSRVGVWGHSNGGSISERIMVISRDVRATVIWAGVSADATDAWLYLRDWLHRPEAQVRAQYGHPDELSDLYRRMSSRGYLADVVGPVQIHHGTADTSVPYQHGVQLDRRLTEAGRPHELFTYPGAPHNWVGPTWDTAIARTLAFFDAQLRA
jgi:uncharacterized protein